MLLKELLEAIKNSNSLNIDLYSHTGLSLISFVLPGYNSLDDELLGAKVASIEIVHTKSIKVIMADPATEDPEASTAAEDGTNG